MRHEIRKAVKIIEELTLYFLTLGATHVESSIDKDGKKGTIHFLANFDPAYESKLEGLEKLLNQPKTGMEDLYWELAGSAAPDENGQLYLVGMMIDRAVVEREGEFIKITVYKELEG